MARKEKQAKRDTRGQIDPKRLIEFTGEVQHPSAGEAAYVDRERGVCVQIWSDTTGCIGTPWEGTLRVSVKHTRAKTRGHIMQRGYGVPITWDELQAVKDHFWPDRIAIEIYPPHEQIVDVAEMRWLWVLPKGACLPFSLSAKSQEILRS